ncbi:MAG: DUF475 domain-containing protein [Cyanobacteriota bacterium]|nr:DUF475 domain-containing protein [Cyanobacteriota bacterium]MED5384224.1 DUF475 domain-containing protein [Cyanobacteriota bacterium]
MDVTTLPSISDWFDGVDQWREVLALLPVLVVLELVLSADNAVALAAIARRCRGQERERVALNTGIALALVLRIGLILVAQWVLQNPVVQLLAATYLLWLFVDHLRSQSPDQETSDDASAEDSAPASLARVILLLAFTDLAFSIDSVAAAVAISDQFLLVITGAVIGIVALRFTSALFIRWIAMYPRLETAGFLAVGFVSLRLFIHVLRPELHQPDWFTLVVVTALFSWGLSRRQLISAPGSDHAG